jgi:hypothetical protein
MNSTTQSSSTEARRSRCTVPRTPLPTPSEAACLAHLQRVRCRASVRLGPPRHACCPQHGADARRKAACGTGGPARSGVAWSRVRTFLEGVQRRPMEGSTASTTSARTCTEARAMHRGQPSSPAGAQLVRKKRGGRAYIWDQRIWTVAPLELTGDFMGASQNRSIAVAGQCRVHRGIR